MLEAGQLRLRYRFNDVSEMEMILRSRLDIQAVVLVPISGL